MYYKTSIVDISLTRPLVPWTVAREEAAGSAIHAFFAGGHAHNTIVVRRPHGGAKDLPPGVSYAKGWGLFGCCWALHNLSFLCAWVKVHYKCPSIIVLLMLLLEYVSFVKGLCRFLLIFVLRSLEHLLGIGHWNHVARILGGFNLTLIIHSPLTIVVGVHWQLR